MMNNPKIAIRNGTIVTMDAQRRVLRDHVIVIEGDHIIALTSAADWTPQPGDEVVDARGRYILPGFVNSHVHTVQHLGRGLSDDVDILTWLHQRIWPYESNLTAEESYISTLLFGLEQIANGTTTVADAGVQHAAATVQAITELGLRAALCHSIMDEGEGLPPSWQLSTDECMALQEEEFHRFHGAASGRVRWWLGLRTLLNNSDDLIKRTAEAAQRLGAWIHMHVAEAEAEIAYCQKTRGTTTVRHLDKLGLLGPNLLAVHCVYVDEEEIALMQARQVKVSHNPAAALRVMGLPKIVEMLEAGLMVGLGTDGAPSNCRNSMIDEMWLAALVQKGRLRNPAAMPAQQILEMATIHSARCLGWENEVGSLEVGKKADLCIINPHTPNMQPIHDPISNMVFSMKTENVESTMCNGVWLMRDRRFTQIDLQEVLREARERAVAVRNRANIKLPERFNWV
jgi:5-methylthioadenosine/S-adenosylhomocysteine deaminase